MESHNGEVITETKAYLAEFNDPTFWKTSKS
jgi:hypothetical protein